MAFNSVCRVLSSTSCSSFCHLCYFFQSLGPRFLVGGDWKAKHTTWGARLITPKGRTFLSAIHECHCTHYSTGEPTYWLTDHHRIPDLLDFFVARGVTANSIRVESVFELSSDHSPIIATVGTHLPHTYHESY